MSLHMAMMRSILKIATNTVTVQYVRMVCIARKMPAEVGENACVRHALSPGLSAGCAM